LGRVPEAYTYLRGLDLFLLTSIKEGLPYSLLEASLADLPIVATNVGGIPEMAEYLENIYLVRVGEVVQVSEKIKLILGNTTSTQIHYPEVFSLENMLEQTEKVYQKMTR
jgi:glycosyltransferase involved in cell wall biosynthesis